MLGWREDELVASSVFDFTHPDDRERSRSGAENLSKGTAFARFDNRYRWRGGSGACGSACRGSPARCRTRAGGLKGNRRRSPLGKETPPTLQQDDDP